jgi:protein-tyrosine-phosphatase
VLCGSISGSVHLLQLFPIKSISQQHSKHLDVFADQSFDYIITVCDRVREVCPLFPSDPERIHWSFADPAAVEDDAAHERAFQQTGQQLLTRIRHLITLISRQQRGNE